MHKVDLEGMFSHDFKRFCYKILFEIYFMKINGFQVDPQKNHTDPRIERGIVN